MYPVVLPTWIPKDVEVDMLQFFQDHLCTHLIELKKQTKAKGQKARKPIHRTVQSNSSGVSTSSSNIVELKPERDGFGAQVRKSLTGLVSKWFSH